MWNREQSYTTFHRSCVIFLISFPFFHTLLARLLAPCEVDKLAVNGHANHLAVALGELKGVKNGGKINIKEKKEGGAKLQLDFFALFVIINNIIIVVIYLRLFFFSCICQPRGRHH